MKLIIGIIFSLLLLCLYVGCTNNNPEKLYPQTGNCDTTKVTFSQDIAPIFKNNCESCHSGSQPSGGRLLDSYDAIARTADSGRLIGSIKHESDFSAMPPTGKLSTCNIDKITAWINKGKPNN